MIAGNRQVSGLLIFLGGAQFLLSLLVAEALAPKYRVADNMISDLGIGLTAPIFNTSVFLFGLSLLACNCFLWQEYRSLLAAIPLAVAGLGAAFVGIFPETTGIPHSAAAGMAFIFGGISAIALSTLLRPPFRFISVGMGILSLLATALLISGVWYGLGPGGMERMIVYPLIIWTVGTGCYLMAEPERDLPDQRPE